jgi:hypothetical protein
MAEFVFTSPGYKFKERDLTFVTRNVGITTLGLVGETVKGPAFEPVFVQDATQFSNRFGVQSTEKLSNGILRYQLPYVANSYLLETNQLYVTRVLGLSGYDAGTAWAITLSAGIDPSTEKTLTGSSVTGGETFSGSFYRGVAINVTGQTDTVFTGFTKNLTNNTFRGVSNTFTVTGITISGGSVIGGKVTKVVTPITGTSYTEYEGMVLAVVRSRGNVYPHSNLPPTTVFDATTLTLDVSANTTNSGIGDMFGQFKIRAVNTGGTQTYTASLNPDASSFLPNVIGQSAKDKNTKIWVQATYPDLIRWIDSEGFGYGINTTLIAATTGVFTNYKSIFQTPETPWVVSQLKGSEVDRLFKFVSISDGDAANQEIKISIENINPISLEFDVYVRAFYDTDANPVMLENYLRVGLIKGQTNYIAQLIGTTDGEYDIKSNYIMIELAKDIFPDLFPAGFEGYELNNYNTGITGSAIKGVTPKIVYKTAYAQGDKIRKVFLGISENAYSTSNSIGTGINQNFFNFVNWRDDASNIISGFTKTKGFHMDSGATGTYTQGIENIGQFEVGAGQFQTVDNVIDQTNPYFDINTRKFTLVPAGGFDGWDVNNGFNNGISHTYGDFYRQGGIYDGVAQGVVPLNDFQAWETAIQTYSNPEEVTINLFATPAINWSDNTVLVQDTIEMIEQQRTDTLYVIDAPLVGNPQAVGQSKQDVQFASDVVDLLDAADIDSSYSCTYFPWIQIRDTQNNVNVYIPPTGEVVKAMAFTDNVAFPWFAPAGLNRGVTDARKSMFKLSEEARNTLYAGRINPMADFADAGTAIFGQKTLQVKGSALDRINVRRLLLQIKVLIANIAIRLVFEQDDQVTIDQFITKATPVLDTIKRERGLNDFRIKMDAFNNTTETNDRNELYGELFLKPTRSLEFIGITFTISPSGASFADVGA